MKFFRLLLLLFATVFFQSLSCSESVQVKVKFEFVDFPLAKVDYMYREQGGVVARLIFDLWCCVMLHLGEEELLNKHKKSLSSLEFLAQREDAGFFSVEEQALLGALKESYCEHATPIFKKLSIFKRFINELVVEAARISILNDGDIVNIEYGQTPHVKLRPKK